jgi:hypothetical protein
MNVSCMQEDVRQTLEVLWPSDVQAVTSRQWRLHLEARLLRVGAVLADSEGRHTSVPTEHREEGPSD